MWTLNNTDGFTQDELDIINKAIGLIDVGGIDQSTINDAITNEWKDNLTAEELAEAVMRRLGKKR